MKSSKVQCFRPKHQSGNQWIDFTRFGIRVRTCWSFVCNNLLLHRFSMFHWFMLFWTCRLLWVQWIILASALMIASMHPPYDFQTWFDCFVHIFDPPAIIRAPSPCRSVASVVLLQSFSHCCLQLSPTSYLCASKLSYSFTRHIGYAGLQHQIALHWLEPQWITQVDIDPLMRTRTIWIRNRSMAINDLDEALDCIDVLHVLLHAIVRKANGSSLT